MAVQAEGWCIKRRKKIERYAKVSGEIPGEQAQAAQEMPVKKGKLAAFLSICRKTRTLAGKVLFWLFVLAVVFVLSLFFREQKLPKAWLDGIAESLSSDGMLVKCDGAAFGFKRGLTLRGLRVYDRPEGGSPKQFFSASLIAVDLLRHIVTIHGASYPKLPDSYYSSGYSERNEPMNFELPDVPDFRLVLISPDILGLRPMRVTAQVDVGSNVVSLDEIHVEWPGRDRQVAENGYFRIDLAEQRAHGEVRGLATQPHIRPLLVALDVPSAMPYFDAFTEVPQPVNAAGEFDVNLVNNDFKMTLDLRPEMGRYNGVDMARAEGHLDLDVKTRGTNCFIRFGVRLPMAVDPKGRQLTGSVAVNLTNEFARLDINARSHLEFGDILAIADFIDPKTLDFIECETPPEITAIGHTGTCAEDSGWNDLAGSAKLWRGSLAGFQLRNLSLDYSLKRDVFKVSNLRANGKDGGALSANVSIMMPYFDEDNMSFEAKCTHTDGTLAEINDIYGLDLDDLTGKFNADFEVSGPLCSNAIERVCGRGNVSVRDGHLLQMNLFAGLTKLLSDWVPGVSYIVNQSQASFDFSVDNGIFCTTNLFIEGGLISLKGWGTYNIPEDNLDFSVRVQFLKKESLLGSIVHPVTWPFTKLLLEFKASGPIKAPDWTYISLLDRVL